MSYADYADGLQKLTRPGMVPDHMPILYAISLGSPITEVRQDGDALNMLFAEGTLTIRDDGQSCCESRYMTTDDDLPSFVGAKLVAFDEAAGPNIEEEPDESGYSYNDPHETMFVRLHTTAGTITLVTHNEHNGYYGGFNVVSRWSEANG
jgi:hypothetical protein